MTRAKVARGMGKFHKSGLQEESSDLLRLSTGALSFKVRRDRDGPLDHSCSSLIHMTMTNSNLLTFQVSCGKYYK